MGIVTNLCIFVFGGFVTLIIYIFLKERYNDKIFKENELEIRLIQYERRIWNLEQKHDMKTFPPADYVKRD